MPVDVWWLEKLSWFVYVGKSVCNKMLRMDHKIIRGYILRVTKVVDECIVYIYWLLVSIVRAHQGMQSILSRY